MLHPTPTQLYLFLIRLQRKISLLCLLHFLIDLKRTILSKKNLGMITGSDREKSNIVRTPQPKKKIL